MKKFKLIDGVELDFLKVIPDERGCLMEILRNDDPMFIKFGQLYVTSAYPGVVKAWHYHKKQTDFFVCIRGMMKVVLYDQREGSSTKGEINEFFIGEKNPAILKIPNLVYHGFKCIGEYEALMLNCPTEVYDRDDPDEYRIDPHNSIPYDWSRRDG